MSRYSIPMSNTTIVADATLVALRAAASASTRGSMLEILSVRVGQQGVTTNQQLGILLASKAAALGTMSTGVTPAPLSVGGAVSGITSGTAQAAGTAGVDASAEGAGTVTAIIADSFSCLNGYLWVPTPEERIILLPGSDCFIVKIVGTPGTLTGWSANVIFREIV
jgi:hypothetical protein